MANHEVDIDELCLTDTSFVCLGPCEKTLLPRICKPCSQRVKTIKAEYEEYKENSTAYETELECLNRQTEEMNKKLCLTIANLQKQVEMLEMKLQSQCTVSNNLQAQLEAAKDSERTILRSLRETETENDNLKQKIRELKLTADQKEEQMDELIEKLVLVETDLEMYNNFKEAVLLLEDENKRLKKLLAVKQNQSNNNIPSLYECESLDKCDQLWEEKVVRSDSSSSEELNKSTTIQRTQLISEFRKISNSNSQDPLKENFKAVIKEFEKNKSNILKLRKSKKIEELERSKEAKVKELEEQKATLKRYKAWPFKKKLQTHSIRSEPSLIDASNFYDKSNYQSDQTKSKKGLLNLLRPKKSL